MNKLKNYLIKSLGGISIEAANKKLKELESCWHEIILSEEQTKFYRAAITKQREHRKDLERVFYFGMEQNNYERNTSHFGK